MGFLARWAFPATLLNPGLSFERGRYRAKGDAEGAWIPIVAPIVAPAEYESLVWARGEYAKELDDAERRIGAVLREAPGGVGVATEAKPPDDLEWGPWITCSKTLLLTALDGSRSNTRRIDRMIEAGSLLWRNTQNPHPPFRHWKYDARLRDPEDRALVLDHVEKAIRTRGRRRAR